MLVLRGVFLDLFSMFPVLLDVRAFWGVFLSWRLRYQAPKKNDEKPESLICKGTCGGANKHVYLVPETSTLKWLFQFDDSKPLLGKLLFHQTSIKKLLFRVPGTS